MYIGAVNSNPWGSRLRGFLDDASDYAFNNLMADTAVMEGKASESLEAIRRAMESPRYCSNPAAVYKDLAKKYDVTNMTEEMLSSLMNEMLEQGLMTPEERLLAGGVYLVDKPLENMASCETKKKDEPFNAAQDYAKSYIDYAQKNNLLGNETIKKTILAHNKVGDMLNEILKYATDSEA